MRLLTYILTFSLILLSFVRSSEALDDGLAPSSDTLLYLLTQANAEDKDSLTRKIFADRALSIALKQQNDSDYQANMFKIANRYWNVNNVDNYYKVTHKILKVSNCKSDSVSIAKAYMYLADYHFTTAHTDSAMFYIKKAQRLYKLLGNVNMEAHCIALKASYFLLQSDYLECGKLYFELLKKKNVDRIYLFEAHLGLGTVYSSLHEFKIAEKYYLKALLISDKGNKDITWTAVVYNNLAILFLRQKDYQLAEIYLVKALNLPHLKLKSPYVYSLVINNMAISKIRSKKLENPNLIFESYRLNKDINYHAGIIDSQLTFAEFYMYKGNFDKANEHAKNAYHLSKKWKYPKEVLKSLQKLWILEPHKASTYAQEYSSLHDSILLSEQRNRNKFARIEYETAELEKQIEQVESEKASLSQLGIILLFVLLTTAVFWWQHVRTKELGFIREKSEQNSQIFELLNNDHQKIQQGKNIEKKRIARELHDGVMGRLTSIRLNLFALKKDTSSATIEKCISHIDSIQEIEKEIRAIAYDLGSDIMSDEVSFISIIKSLFASIEEHSDIHLHCDSARDIPWNAISNNTKMQVYRIIQESLHNIEKHAQAQNAFILICATEKHIEFIIRDDGKGFCKKKIKKGFGLANIYGRARTIKAQVKIDSILNSGTTIILKVPFENNTPKTNEDDHTNTYD